jgi:hypothetical protein
LPGHPAEVSILDPIPEVLEHLILEDEDDLFILPPRRTLVIGIIQGGHPNLDTGASEHTFQHPMQTP